MSPMWWSRHFTTKRSLRFFGMALGLVGLQSCAARAPDSQASSAGETVRLAPTVPSATPLRPSTVVDAPPSPQALADARHVLNRFAFGPRPGEVERVARLSVDRWFEQQLTGPEDSPYLAAVLEPHRIVFAPPAQLVDDWLGPGWESGMRDLRELREEAKPQYRDHLARLATAELTRDILSQRQLEAVMTDFWANHFNVFATKGVVRIFVGDYLERAIRPFALGSFSQLLLATARHPAMLIYLDNAESRKESGRARGKRRRGLNENYARELLELHTLGVDGGYTQDDVQNVARIFTGWSVARLNEGGFKFVFRGGVHDRGEKVVLGRTFPPGGDHLEGRQLLELLAHHPATAKHVATRLCQRFVADIAPPSCVLAASSAFLESGGNIRQVLRAIFNDPSFWQASTRSAKLKTPLELLASACRALGAKPDGSLAVAKTLANLGEPLLQERVPTGYPDSEPEWASGGGMLARLNFASELGEGKLPGLDVPWEETFPAGVEVRDAARLFGVGTLGLSPTSATLRVVDEQLVGLSARADQRATAVALLLGSPEFQRQ
jgi:Protein of unknown function (DUF1800)